MNTTAEETPPATQRLRPSIRSPPSSTTASVSMRDRSEPACGSVIENAA